MPIGVIYLDTGCTESLAVLTLEDEQIVWMDKSSQTDKSSDVKMGRTNFRQLRSLNLSISP